MLDVKDEPMFKEDVSSSDAPSIKLPSSLPELSVKTFDVARRSPGWFTFVTTLTFLRGALVLPVIILLHSGHHIDVLSAFILSVVAANFDWMDGFFARRKNVVSNLGRWFDPIADKIFYLVALVALYNYVKTVFIVIIVALELFLIAHRVWVYLRKREADVSSNWKGKAKAVMQCVLICALLLGIYLEPYSRSWSYIFIDWLAHGMLLISTGFAFLSAAAHIGKHSIPTRKKSGRFRRRVRSSPAMST